MCPSFMVTQEEAHSTRGRANVLRMAMAGQLGDAGLSDEGVHEVLDLCLECRACKAECPVGVDVARYKSEFLSGYWERHGAPLESVRGWDEAGEGCGDRDWPRSRRPYGGRQSDDPGLEAQGTSGARFRSAGRLRSRERRLGYVDRGQRGHDAFGSERPFERRDVCFGDR